MRTVRFLLALSVLGLFSSVPSFGQAIWQVTRFDIAGDVSGGERALSARATLAMKNVGRDSASTVTLRINPKAQVSGARIGDAPVNPRSTPDGKLNLQRISLNLPTAIAPGGGLTVAVDYKIAVESNTGVAAISPVTTQFLPLSNWYPEPNSQFSPRGSDTAPFHLAVTMPSGTQILSSGKIAGSNVEQGLNGMPFFMAGSWDTVEGSSEAKGISAMLPKGAGADEQKQAQQLVAYVQAVRSFYSSMLGPVPDAPIRIVAVTRGAGFSDGGVVLVDPAVFRRPQIDAGTASLLAESVARLWLGGSVPIRGEGAGVLREGLSRYLAVIAIEKQFGTTAASAELNRERLAYSAVAKRDAPLAVTTPADDTYFNTVSNKGAMFWHLMDRNLGREALIVVMKAQLQAATSNDTGLTLASMRQGLAQRGDANLKAIIDSILDKPTDLDLMVGLPLQKGAQWSAAVRNTGTFDAAVSVAGFTESGQRITVQTLVPAQGFGEALFTSSAKIARVEIDPDKLYPQIDYSNDVAPRAQSPDENLRDATAAFGRQDYPRAESELRAVLAALPTSQEAHVLLGRTLVAQGKIEDAEREFNTALKDPLPTASTLAWSNVGLAEIAIRRGQNGDALKRYDAAVKTDAEYASTLASRLGRIKADSGGAQSVDASVQEFITQLDQAVKSGHKNDLDQLIVPGELSTFVKGIVGSQPDMWQTKVVRTEQLDANRMAADVAINARELGRDQSGTAVLMLARVNGNWKLNSIEFFEVR
jgi:Tfp pilus assembly protein PilF